LGCARRELGRKSGRYAASDDDIGEDVESYGQADELQDFRETANGIRIGNDVWMYHDEEGEEGMADGVATGA